MIVSFESGCDWADASYHLMETSLTEAEMEAKEKEWRELYWTTFRAHNGPGQNPYSAVASIGDFSAWLERQGLAKRIQVPTYSDMA